jgi:hypothetical protein
MRLTNSRWVAGLSLAAVFGALAFPSAVQAVTVPLSNLFDDAKGTALNTAIATDTFAAQAGNTNLGVTTTISGGLNVNVSIAPGVLFNFGPNLGAGATNAGGIINDAARNVVNPGPGVPPIRTTGTNVGYVHSGVKVEDGIGMHADNLITFDLAELRTAGGLSTFGGYFTARAGLNDSVAATGQIKTAAVLSDASGNVIAAYINGELRPVTQVAGVWQFTSSPANNTITSAATRLAQYAVAIPVEAQYLTLVVAQANGDANTDHGVFAGANWDSHAIPLSNLFDDAKGTALAAAVASNTYQAGATNADLGVERVIDGNLNVAQFITPNLQFNLASAGGNSFVVAGGPGNDTFRDISANAIVTRGFNATTGTTLVEDGIGMHANELITFDLAEIRDAGGLGGTDLNFLARAGVNDSAATNGSIRSIVIVSDAAGNILTALVNGVAVPLTSAAGVFSFNGALPAELTALGNNYVDYNLLLGSDARYLTLAFTSGADAGSDHGVWSGARLTFNQILIPEPASLSLLSLASLTLLRRRRAA